MGLHTPLYDTHIQAGARMVDFGGWDMPVNYGSQIDEHHAVRRDAGMFDVSHMCVLDLSGARTRDFLRYLLANDVAKLTQSGQALYSCMLNERGGVVDDLIVYRRGDAHRLVVNAGTRDKDIAWIKERAQSFDVGVRVRDELAMIAVQGPHAREKAASLLGSLRQQALALPVFGSAEDANFFVGRTGYTGEDGFEIILPASQAASLWRQLREAGVAQCGLGARDTLRLEAGMNLYGNDMNENVTPLESGLAWTVAFEPRERDFVGRAALEAQLREGVRNKLVGLLLDERGVLRSHQKVIAPNVGEGEVTSGTFSPTLERSIALARVPATAQDRVQVEIRGKLLPARVVKYPFVRSGKVLVNGE